MSLTEFCRTLRAARIEQGLSQWDVASVVDVATGTVSAWETTTSRPLDVHLRAWAAHLGVPVPPGVVGGEQRVARCGTAGGYKRHLTKNQPTCGACRAAINANQASRRAS